MSGPKTYVDLSSYPDMDSDEFLFLPAEEQFLLEEYHNLVEEATVVPAGTTVICKEYCHEVDGDGVPCQGDVEVIRRKSPSQFEWSCQYCGQRGVITGFEGGKSDLRHLTEEEMLQHFEQKYGGSFPGEDGPMIDELIDIMMEGMDAEEEKAFVNWFENLPEEQKEKMMNELSESINGLQKMFEETTGELTTQQLYNLLVSDWETGSGSVQLNKNLPADELKHSILFHNSRTMLLKAQKEDGLGLTKSGNLQRKPISELIPDCTWPEGYMETIHSVNKVIDEYDVWLLHTSRVLLGIAGLLRKYKGKVKGVKKHAGLSLPSRSGELYHHLFVTYFRMMNISFLSNNHEDFPNVQECVPYSLYRLQKLAGEWISMEELPQALLLPVAYDELMEKVSYYSKPGKLLYYLLLNPLELFGLLETRKTGDKPDKFTPPDQCRKTPLFDKFITFRV